MQRSPGEQARERLGVEARQPFEAHLFAEVVLQDARRALRSDAAGGHGLAVGAEKLGAPVDRCRDRETLLVEPDQVGDEAFEVGADAARAAQAAGDVEPWRTFGQHLDDDVELVGEVLVEQRPRCTGVSRAARDAPIAAPAADLR